MFHGLCLSQFKKNITPLFIKPKHIHVSFRNGENTLMLHFEKKKHSCLGPKDKKYFHLIPENKTIFPSHSGRQNNVFVSFRETKQYFRLVYETVEGNTTLLEGFSPKQSVITPTTPYFYY